MTSALSSLQPASRLCGVPLHQVDVDGVLGFIRQTLRSGQRARVFNANAHLLTLASRNTDLRAACCEAELLFCDGFGPKLAARILDGVNLPRLTPPDWIDQLVAMCAIENRSLYFLGAAPGVAESAVERLSQRHPNARFVGWEDGYFDKAKHSAGNTAVLERINAAKPDVLIVGFGMPLQEYWLRDNWTEMNVGIAITAGALFDYVAGTVWRGPRWMTDNGLEWLSRLVVEPRRLWRRYVLGLPLFFLVVIKDAVRRDATGAA
jgi:N-acetylglucosaminyldiphosphoundecaprenol N-acetyl-beta-D-mannosaminyltransferase